MPPSILEFIVSNGNNPFAVAWLLFGNGGWLVFVIAMLWIVYDRYMDYMAGRFIRSQKYIVLAIDIPRKDPKDDEQSFKSVEQIFAQLAGVQKQPNLTERYLEGEVQLSISLEIVSIDGYIQFMIWSPSQYRNNIESAIYAQYPDAEITEVEDYVKRMPQELPNDELDLFGTELILSNDFYYPIKTYRMFEDMATGTTIDPMAGLLEIMSRILPGEQLWFQIVITPTDHKWRDGGIRLVKKLVKAKIEAKAGLIEKGVLGTLGWVSYLGEQTIGAGLLPGAEEKKEGPPTIMQHLTPGEVDTVKAIQEKISKIGFYTRFRILYIGRREIFSKKRVWNPMFGAVKQFNNQMMNGWRTDPVVSTNKAEYFFIKYRTRVKQRRIYKFYSQRRPKDGASKGDKILNIEELASMWHFPLMTVKAPIPTVAKTKKQFPPAELPVAPAALDASKAARAENPLADLNEVSEPVPIPEEDTQWVTTPEADEVQEETSDKTRGAPPPNLPIG